MVSKAFQAMVTPVLLRFIFQGEGVDQAVRCATLTTLSYGATLPLTSSARAFASLEALER